MVKRLKGPAHAPRQVPGNPTTSAQVVAGAVLELARACQQQDGAGACVWTVPVVLNGQDDTVCVAVGFGPHAVALEAFTAARIATGGRTFWQRVRAKLVRPNAEHSKDLGALTPPTTETVH